MSARGDSAGLGSFAPNDLGRRTQWKSGYDNGRGGHGILLSLGTRPRNHRHPCHPQRIVSPEVRPNLPYGERSLSGDINLKLLKVWLRLAIKTLRRDLRFSLFFVANLSIAFTALLFLETVRDSVTGALASQSQRILGADLTINSRRPLTEVEIEALLTALPKDSSTVRMVESLTMVKSPSKSRLVQIRAVEPGFPFYGQIRLKSGVIERIDPSNLSSQEIWLYPELFTQLNVEEGDQVLVGGRPFTVRQEVVDDIPGAGGFSSFAPRAYLLLSELEKTDLLGFGSTATRSWFAKIPASSDADAVVALIEKTIPDPAVRIQSHGKSGNRVDACWTT